MIPTAYEQRELLMQADQLEEHGWTHASQMLRKVASRAFMITRERGYYRYHVPIEKDVDLDTIVSMIANTQGIIARIGWDFKPAEPALILKLDAPNECVVLFNGDAK